MHFWCNLKFVLPTLWFHKVDFLHSGVQHSFNCKFRWSISAETSHWQHLETTDQYVTWAQWEMDLSIFGLAKTQFLHLHKWRPFYLYFMWSEIWRGGCWFYGPFTPEHNAGLPAFCTFPTVNLKCSAGVICSGCQCKLTPQTQVTNICLPGPDRIVQRARQLMSLQSRHWIDPDFTVWVHLDAWTSSWLSLSASRMED